MLVVVRVWLPDRPGALGQVASRIGSVRGDVLGIEILEVGGGRVIDELVVDLDAATPVELLIAEVAMVDGVSVEHVRPVEGDRIDPDLVALSVGAELAESDADDRMDRLCQGLVRVADAEWAVVVKDGEIRHARGTAPEPGWLVAFLEGSQHLGRPGEPGAGTDHSPSDIVWAHLPRSGVAVAAGRSDRPVHERERLRVTLLARLADALVC